MKTLMTHASNLRSVRNATFIPAESGVTAVVGDNGTGKTTMTTIVPLIAAWGDAKNTAGPMGAILAEGARSGMAVWEFDHAGHTYHVERTITRAKSGAVSSRAKITCDGKDGQFKGLRTSDVGPAITNVLGFGPDEFLATSLIAQNEVDSLTSSNPAAVRDQVRSTLGLDRMLRTADRVERDINPQRKNLPDAPDQDTIDTAETAVEVSESKLRTYTTQRDAAKAALNAAESAYQRAESTFATAAQAMRAFDIAKSSVAYAESMVAKAQTQLDQARSGAPTDVTKDANAEYLENWTALRSELRALGATMVSLDPNAAEQATRAIDQAKQAVTEQTNRVEQATAAVDAAMDQDTGATLAREENSLRTQAAAHTKAAQALRGQGECPTCGTHLDDSAALVASLEKMASEATAKADAIKQKFDAGAAERDRATRELDAAKAALEQARQAELNAERANDDVLRTIKANEATAAKIDLMRGEWDAASLDAAVDGAKNNVARFDAVERAEADLAKAQAQHESAVAELDKLGDHATATTQAAEAEAARDHARDEYATKRTEHAEAAERARAEESAYASARGYLDDLLTRRQARLDAEAAIEVQLKTAAALREFTLARTREVTSIIEQAVVSLLPLSGSRFTGFRLDDFTPQVTDGDTWRNTTELSGGEKSVVGLLFRIGVSAAVDGGTLDTTIVADEPLANLDAHSRERVSEVLAALPCPVVVISHSPEPMDNATKVVRFSRDAQGYTHIDE